jgi:hypothetical protein
MLTLTPRVSVAANVQPTYNVGMAETFSWVPVDNNANRLLFARSSYTTNFRDMSFTKCETRTSGNPSFISRQILLHNEVNHDVNVRLTLTSGTSCDIPVGKNTSANHILNLSLQVSAVHNYAGTTITFFA